MTCIRRKSLIGLIVSLIMCLFASHSWADTPPVLSLSSDIPQETAQEMILVEGTVSDDAGIMSVTIRVKNDTDVSFIKAATLESVEQSEQQQQFKFTQNVPLKSGQNQIIIQAIDTNSQGARVVKNVLRTGTRPVVRPTPQSTSSPPTPQPALPTPTPPKSPEELLLEKAETYFRQQWYLSGGPNNQNAYEVYQEILQLNPSNRQARQRMYDMLNNYRSWGETNADRGDIDKAGTYYQRALHIAEYLVTTLQDADAEPLLQHLQDVMTASSAPTPSPIPPTPTSVPIIFTPTPVPSTPTPVTVIPTPVPTVPPPTPDSTTPTSSIIRLISTIPKETTEQTLTITGIAEDPGGIVAVQIEVKPSHQKGLLIGSYNDDLRQEPQNQIEFTEEVTLASGTNDIHIIVVNISGQEYREQFQVTRLVEAAPVLPDVGEVYAVIIGIAEYEDSRLNLNYTVNDAQGLYDVLTDPQHRGVPAENIRLLLNEDATDRNIKGAIGRWLSRQADEEDTVIIYYSGHGAPEGDETYWVTHNADIDDLYTTALSNDEIFDMLSRIRSKRVITFLDSCYSAATVHRENRTRDVATQIPWDKFIGTGRVAISASDGKQLSLELNEYQHGVFTYYLLEGLRGAADTNQDYVVDVDEIWDYVKYNVIDAARQAGNTQTPVLQGSMTAGIALTFNQAGVDKKQKLEKLGDLFEQGTISIEHFDCAFRMIEAGETNRYLDGLLSDKLSADVFNRFFRCPLP